jgi:uncharacterized protein YjeT (DUF2065 family)
MIELPHSMIEMAGGVVTVMSALYLLGLAAVAWFAPQHAARFLLGFAGSARVHFFELLLRLIVGGGFLYYAPHMLFSQLFVILGWVLIITTAGLCLVPWRWHQRFAQRTVPHAIGYLKLIGIASLAFGVFIVLAVFCGPSVGTI